MLPQDFRFKALALFPNLRRVILDDDATPYTFLPLVARAERRAKDDAARRDIFRFAEWCLRRHEPEVRDAISKKFFAQLFDDRFGDWSIIISWLSPFVLEEMWSLWEQRLSSDDRARLEAMIGNRSEVRYQPIAIAIQTMEATFPRRPPLPDVHVGLSMRVEFPASFGAGLGISYSFHEQFPDKWDLELDTFISEAIHHGFSRSEEPALHHHGIAFHVDLLSLAPTIEETTDEQEVREIGEMLYVVAESLVTSLCQGLIVFNLVSRDESKSRVSDWIMPLAVRKREALVDD